MLADLITTRLDIDNMLFSLREEMWSVSDDEIDELWDYCRDAPKYIPTGSVSKGWFAIKAFVAYQRRGEKPL